MEKPEAKKKFGEFLTTCFESRGWNQAELAKRAELSRQAVARHLSGRGLPSRGTRKLYAQAFSIDPDVFEVMWRNAKNGVPLSIPGPPPDMRPLNPAREALANRPGPLDPSSGETPLVPFPWRAPDYLADASRKDRLETGLGIPLRTFVEGGNAVQYFDNVLTDKYLPTALIPRPEWGVSAFQVRGDSMAPRIMPGDIVFVGERLQNVRNGDIVVVALKTGGLTIKNLNIVDAETWELVPTNPASEKVTVNVAKQVDWYVPVLGWFCPHYLRREVPWERDS